MKKNSKQAFTLVELMLACAFLGTMLLAIAALTIRIVNIYKKGLSLRSVNSIGRDIMNDLDRNIGGAKLGALEINPEIASGKVTQSAIEEARDKYFYAKEKDDGSQAYGIFCTGSMAYIWNTAPTLKDVNSGASEDAIKIVTDRLNNKTHYPRLARVNTSGFDLCDQVANDASTPREVEVPNYTELINKEESDLAIYDFVVQPAVSSSKTGHAYYSISFVLATMSGGVNIMSNGDYCKGENLQGEEEFSKIGLEYCAVNKFDMVVQQSATNKTRER